MLGLPSKPSLGRPIANALLAGLSKQAKQITNALLAELSEQAKPVLSWPITNALLTELSKQVVLSSELTSKIFAPSSIWGLDC